MENEILRINENTWRIEDSGVRVFLLAGKVKGVQEELYGRRITAYDLGFATLLCDR